MAFFLDPAHRPGQQLTNRCFQFLLRGFTQYLPPTDAAVGVRVFEQLEGWDCFTSVDR